MLFGKKQPKPSPRVFPPHWTPDVLVKESYALLQDPQTVWSRQGVTRDPSAKNYRNGHPVRFRADGVRDNVKMRIIVEPTGEGIIAACPLVTDDSDFPKDERYELFKKLVLTYEPQLGSDTRLFFEDCWSGEGRTAIEALFETIQEMEWPVDEATKHVIRELATIFDLLSHPAIKDYLV